MSSPFAPLTYRFHLCDCVSVACGHAKEWLDISLQTGDKGADFAFQLDVSIPSFQDKTRKCPQRPGKRTLYASGASPLSVKE